MNKIFRYKLNFWQNIESLPNYAAHQTNKKWALPYIPNNDSELEAHASSVLSF